MPDNSEQYCFQGLTLEQQGWFIREAILGLTPGAFAGLTNTQLRATPVPVSLPTGTVTDPWTALVSASGTAAAIGAKNVTIWASSDFVGTVNGVTFLANASITRSAPYGFTLPAYAYTRSAGTLYVARMS